MKRKLLSALLCVAMVASMLTGCGSAKSEEAAATAPAAEAETAAPAAEATAETAASSTTENPVAGKKVAYIMIMPSAGICTYYAERGGLLIGFETEEA